VQKTKTMTVGKRHEQLRITLDGEELEQVNEFMHLGGLVTEDGKAIKDMLNWTRCRERAIYQARQKLNCMKHSYPSAAVWIRMLVPMKNR